MLYFRIDSSHVFLLLLLIGGKKWLGNVFAGYWLWSYDIKQEQALLQWKNVNAALSPASLQHAQALELFSISSKFFPNPAKQTTAKQSKGGVNTTQTCCNLAIYNTSIESVQVLEDSIFPTNPPIFLLNPPFWQISCTSIKKGVHATHKDTHTWCIDVVWSSASINSVWRYSINQSHEAGIFDANYLNYTTFSSLKCVLGLKLFFWHSSQISFFDFVLWDPFLPLKLSPKSDIFHTSLFFFSRCQSYNKIE